MLVRVVLVNCCVAAAAAAERSASWGAAGRNHTKTQRQRRLGVLCTHRATQQLPAVVGWLAARRNCWTELQQQRCGGRLATVSPPRTLYWRYHKLVDLVEMENEIIGQILQYQC